MTSKIISLRAKEVVFALVAVFLVVALSGCTLQIGGGAKKSGSAQIDGGVWRSTDSGVTWAQTVAVPATGGKTASIANVDVRRIVFDPSDSSAIYLATEVNGIIYSYDGGVTWRQFKELNIGRIRSIAVDAHSKCVIYAVGENKLFKSVDCGRTWQNPYYHQNAKIYLTDVAIDQTTTSVVYLATSAGEILKSSNGGQTWSVSYRVKNGLFLDVIIDPFNHNIIYATTEKHGIYKTIDGGRNWNSLDAGLKSYAGSQDYKKLIVGSATKNNLILLTKYSMLRSKDGGTTWEIVELLPAPKSTLLYTAAVSPKNAEEIYYATRTSLVKSIDGGKSWSSQKLPFARSVGAIAINPENSKVIYLGAFNETSK
ncbi:MAG: hypothetical protein AAB358_00645 [Patescibacteria group bacterium]